ncbi:hypothetical protein A2U01_0099610, partial [Trifolium medium]|nr:hypothetical protein [Trifolium medium]
CGRRGHDDHAADPDLLPREPRYLCIPGKVLNCGPHPQLRPQYC